MIALADQEDAALHVLIALTMMEVEEEVLQLRAAGCKDAEIVAFLRSVPS